MFKKVLIADSLAPLVNEIFLNYQNLEEVPFGWEQYILHFKFIAILVNTLI